VFSREKLWENSHPAWRPEPTLANIEDSWFEIDDGPRGELTNFVPSARLKKATMLPTHRTEVEPGSV